MWEADYRQDVCSRLRSAVDALSGPDFEPAPLSALEPITWGKLDEPRERLLNAAQVISVLTDEEFPADFRTQFREIMRTITANSSRNIPEGIVALTSEQALALHETIVALHADTCGE